MSLTPSDPAQPHSVVALSGAGTGEDVLAESNWEAIDRLLVTLPGEAVDPRFSGYTVVAEGRPWREEGPPPPPRGPAVAVAAGGRVHWATIERITVARAGSSLRLVQRTDPDGALRVGLEGLEAPHHERDVLALLRHGRRLLVAAAARLGGRPAQLTPDAKRRVLAALLHRAVRDGTRPGALTLDLVAELLDEACERGAVTVAGKRIALPPPLSDHALAAEDIRARRRRRMRQWLADIGLARWADARTALLALTP
jgi:hypothetical protein